MTFHTTPYNAMLSNRFQAPCPPPHPILAVMACCRSRRWGNDIPAPNHRHPNTNPRKPQRQEYSVSFGWTLGSACPTAMQRYPMGYSHIQRHTIESSDIQGHAATGSEMEWRQPTSNDTFQHPSTPNDIHQHLTMLSDILHSPTTCNNTSNDIQ